jgi:hypothetical protein
VRGGSSISRITRLVRAATPAPDARVTSMPAAAAAAAGPVPAPLVQPFFFYSRTAVYVAAFGSKASRKAPRFTSSVPSTVHLDVLRRAELEYRVPGNF